MEITKDQINHIAKLSNLPLSSAEQGIFADIFNQTLSYIEILDKLDTSNVEPTFQVNGQKNVFQQTPTNLNKATLSQEEALQNASDPVDGKFGTKAVFER